MADRTMEILLVEDSPDDVLFTREALVDADLPHRLSVARDGEEAMAFLRREGDHGDAPVPDLILLDLNLPRKDGREVLTEVKGDAGLREIPIVVLTTSSSDEDIMHSYRSYVNSYIRKPVTFEKFVEAVQAIGRYWFSLVTLPRGPRDPGERAP
jgi:chemotaxis family two-component system response regulator Rcp1